MKGRWLVVLLVTACMTAAPALAGRPPGAGGGGTGGGGSGTSGYTGQNLGTLPGDKHSDAWDVNSSGHVVGRSYGDVMRAFYWNGVMVELPPSELSPGEVRWEAEANAISDAPNEFAVGYEDQSICVDNSCSYQQRAVYWNSMTGSADATRGERGGFRSINGDGTLVVGWGGGLLGVVWARANENWTRYKLAADDFDDPSLPPPFTPEQNHEVAVVGYAHDINNAGYFVGTLQWYDKTQSDFCAANQDIRPCYVVTGSRAYVARLSGAAFVARVLPMSVDQPDASAYAVSNVSSEGKIYIAGYVGNHSAHLGNGYRWAIAFSDSGLPVIGDCTVDTCKLLDRLAWAEGIDDSGAVAGTMNTTPDRRGNIIQTAMLWKPSNGGEYIPLKPPKGGSDSAARSMAKSPDGTIFYVVGETNAKGAWTAARWVIPASPSN